LFSGNPATFCRPAGLLPAPDDAKERPHVGRPKAFNNSLFFIKKFIFARAVAAASAATLRGNLFPEAKFSAPLLHSGRCFAYRLVWAGLIMAGLTV
jgi:hypothetical protein